MTHLDKKIKKLEEKLKVLKEQRKNLTLSEKMCKSKVSKIKFRRLK